MQNRYYYLTASLPYLYFEKEPPISIEDFISECRKWLSKKDINIIGTSDINNIEIKSSDPKIIKDWKIFNIALLEELAMIRKAIKTHTIEKASVSVRDIFEEINPLLMEKRFERIRWDYIEQKEFLFQFDINRLVIYLFKLQILKRLAQFDKETGEKVFAELTEVQYA